MGKILSPIEEKWINNWIEGISEFIARSPNESPEETKKEAEMIKKIFMEKKEELIPIVETWRKRLLEVLTEV